jgi:glycosyltransferase involved in cell wall biosynthesis
MPGIAAGAEAPGEGVSIIVPSYNEEQSVVETARQILEAMEGTGRPFEIVFVDDGSRDATSRRLEESGLPVRVVRNERNLGYGASIKRGIDETGHPLVAITDADGTYPNDRLPELIDAMDGAEMAVGARTGRKVQIPLLRRPAKWAIGKLANYLVGRRIPDLNSGLRVMRRRSLERLRNMLPDGFSLTTTITLALLCRGHVVRYIPVDYYVRTGRSSIRPIRDTLNFVQLIVRTVMYFSPLKVFVPLGLVFVLASAAVLAAGILYLGRIPDITTIILFVTGVQILVLGFLADLIDKRLG